MLRDNHHAMLSDFEGKISLPLSFYFFYTVCYCFAVCYDSVWDCSKFNSSKTLCCPCKFTPARMGFLCKVMSICDCLESQCHRSSTGHVVVPTQVMGGWRYWSLVVIVDGYLTWWCCCDFMTWCIVGDSKVWWKHPVLTHSKKQISQPLTTLPTEDLKTKAVSIFKVNIVQCYFRSSTVIVLCLQADTAVNRATLFCSRCLTHLYQQKSLSWVQVLCLGLYYQQVTGFSTPVWAVMALCVWLSPVLQQIQMFCEVKVEQRGIEYHVAHIQTLLENIYAQPGLCNEVYCQLIRQCSNHPNPTGYEVLQVSQVTGS